MSSYKRRFHNDLIIITQVFARHSQNPFTTLSYKRVDELGPKLIAIGVRTGVARWAMAPPNASAGAPRRAVNAGSPVKFGRGPLESEGPPPRVPVRFIGFY